MIFKILGMNIEVLEPYAIYLAISLVGVIGLYFRTYLKEKAKISALKSENKILVEQSESIKAKYNKEIEEIKEFHQLDIEKRKYQYESKKEQYLNFFRLLDSFTRDANKITQEKLLPILDEFSKNYLNAANNNNKIDETKAVTVMSKKIQKLMFDANEDLIKIKQETNTIRLIASDNIIKKLNLLELAYDKNMEKANKMMSDLPKLMLLNDQNKMNDNQKEIEKSGMVIQSIKNEIIELMREELNEI